MASRRLPPPEIMQKMQQWKDGLIQKGWTDGYESPPPPDAVIEYHAVWIKNRIFSGRCRLNDYDKLDNERAGSHRFLMVRWDRLDVPERVWRISNK